MMVWAFLGGKHQIQLPFLWTWPIIEKIILFMTRKKVCVQRKLRSESSLCAQCVTKGPRFLRAVKEDSDQTKLMPRLFYVLHVVDFPMLWRIYVQSASVIESEDTFHDQ